MNFTSKDVESMIAAQHELYFTGVTKSPEFRKEMLIKLRDAIVKNEEEIIEALQKDLGKSAFESYVTEIGFVLSSIKDMLENIDAWMKPKSAKTPVHLQPAKSFVVREPYGSVLIIGPFNYPFQLLMEPLVGAIVGGNCAIVKPSESAINTVKIVNKIISETFSPSYIRVVEGEREETSALIHAPFDYIFFTGSVAVGKVVMKAAAERLTPVTLELGGKSPAIVDQTANLTNAAERVVWGKFINTGQTCVAPDYLLVHHSVKAEFIEKIIETIQKFYGENPSESEDYGRIINERQYDRLVAIIEKEWPKVIHGGDFDRASLYIEPTILDQVTWGSRSMEDEIFGPILPILEYDNLAEAIHRIRQLPKPLSAYMFTENEEAANYFIESLPFGGGCINDTVSHVGNTNLPFGGVGTSGMNAYHGKYSFEAFTHAKAIMKRSTKVPMRLALPPYGNKLKFVKPLLR